MSTRILSLFALFFCMLAIMGCATSPVPAKPLTGWISYDPITSQGVYIQSDGTRLFAGRNVDGDVDGRTTVYRGDIFKNYTLGYWNKDVPPGYNGMSSRRNVKDGAFVPGPTTVVVPGDYGFIFKGMSDEKGFKGPGKLVRNDGFYLEAMFDYKPMPINWIGGNADSIEVTTYGTIGSYAYGKVKAYWPNGDIFEGQVLDFFPFKRSSYDVVCLPSTFYGHGILKRPGKKNHIGFVRENRGAAEPTTKDDLLEHIRDHGDCASEANAVRVKFQNSQMEYNKEMVEGRRKANAELAAHFAQLPNKIVNDMARVESASRGSSVEMDRENTRKNAVLYEILLNTNLSAQSDPQLSSKRIDKATLPNTATQIVPVSKKTYPFTRSITYQSSYANLTKEKALETVNSERIQREPIFMGGSVTNWRVVSVSAPVCAIREDIREVGHWICNVTVNYSGETKSNPESKPSTNTQGQAR